MFLFMQSLVKFYVIGRSKQP